MPPIRLFLTSILLLLSTTLAAEAQAARVPLYDNLGSYPFAVSTKEPLARRYFEQGMRLYYAFNHAEAIRAFGEGARRDSTCAMCHWGVALSHGPNINMPMDSASAAAAYDAIAAARSLAEFASIRERRLIAALSARYATSPVAPRPPLDSAYALAMAGVVAADGGDDDAAVLYAEALMDLSPWNYWHADGTPRPSTGAALGSLEAVLARSPDHPGANHFYIHAVEAVDPARAVPMAERLAGLMPGAGHLVHMPGHIYVRVGRYADAITANEHAVHADEEFIRDQRPAFGVYTAGYYPHNYDFLAFAASMIGRRDQAMGAARKMTTIASAEILRAPGMTFTQHHLTRHLQLAVRFGAWDDVMRATAPDADLLHARAMWHYARGRMFAANGDVPRATAELARLHDAASDSSLADARLEFNSAGAILRLAAAVLAAHVAEAGSNVDSALTLLDVAVGQEDALSYGEPPEWTVPVRQELGAMLLRAGRPADAERAFRADLVRFPDNGWSLRGLAQALQQQGREAEAASTRSRFAAIWDGDAAAAGAESATPHGDHR